MGCRNGSFSRDSGKNIRTGGTAVKPVCQKIDRVDCAPFIGWAVAANQVAYWFSEGMAGQKKQGRHLMSLPALKWRSEQNQPQLPEPQEPEEQPPPPPTGLAEEMPNPERGPASTYSTLMEPQVSNRVSSTRKVRSLWLYTLSFSFGSSRANPKEGPAQPPCIRATRRADSILFWLRYSLSFDTARSVTVRDMKSSFSCFVAALLNVKCPVSMNQHCLTSP